MKNVSIFFKKSVSVFLSFVLLTGSSLSFAQEETEEITYKPASSFSYEYFTLGKTNEVNFIKKLAKDMEEHYYDNEQEPSAFQDEIIIDDEDPIKSKFKRYNRVAKAYNDFMYYNTVPEESPYWKWTALVPDDNVSAEETLLILEKHQQITQEIIKLFKQNPRYKREREAKRTIIGLGGFTFLMSSWALWTGISGLPILGKWYSSTAIMGLEIFLDDYAIYGIRNLQGMKEWLNDIDIQIAELDNLEERNILKSQIESRNIAICENAKKEHEICSAKRGIMPIDEDECEKWWSIVKFCNYNKAPDNKNIRLELGKYLHHEYQKMDAAEYRIKYARKEMLRIYYALLFIREELKDTNDRLRFDRAFIDLITAYKIANVTISSGRLVDFFSSPQILMQTEILEDKAGHKNDFIGYDENGNKIYTQLGYDLTDKSDTLRSYPSLLSRSQVNYIVQKIDIRNQKTDKEGNDKMERFWNEQYKQNRWEASK